MKSFEVIVVGRGMTGLSTAWHLRRLGISSLCVVGPPRTPGNCASQNVGYASVSLHDNITRAAHGHGSSVASDLLSLNRRGFTELAACADSMNVRHVSGQVIRVAETNHERLEMKKAVSWLREHGFPAGLSEDGPVTIQLDGAASMSLDVNTLLDRLERTVDSLMLPETVVRLESRPDHVAISTESGETLSAEIVVAACHTGIKTLVPAMKECLVNHADQWMEFDFSGQHELLVPGNLIFSGHSNFWFSVPFKGRLRAGGARFLRNWAGVEASVAEALPSVEKAVRQKIERLFGVQLGKTESCRGLLDIRSCDELPIIGPLHGDSRIIVASGYMGSGLTMGFAAGHGIAEIIMSGKSEMIPSIFHPNRLRSLADGV